MRKKLLVTIFTLAFVLITGCQSLSGQENPVEESNPVDSGGQEDTENVASENSNPPDSTDTPDSQVKESEPNTDTDTKNESTKSDVNADEEEKINTSKEWKSPVTAVRIIDPISGWVGGKGWIARTDNKGKEWTIQYQGEQTIQQIFALNGEEAWAVLGEETEPVEQYRIVRTTDGGNNWTPVSRMPNDGFLHFTSSQDAFVSNAYSSDGGKTWNTFDVPENIVGNAYFHDKQNGWAVTQDEKNILVKRTSDGGQTWKTVMNKELTTRLNGALIRSAGNEDAWIELIGDSGMSQTSYSLFHTMDGGNNWLTVIANSTAGAGPAPGFTMDDKEGFNNNGSKPGPLYVVNPKVAFMGGACPACDNSNSVGWTTDGGETWNNGDEQTPGYGEAFLAVADDKNGWWITTDSSNPSVLYTTSNGGIDWEKAYTFD